jgi:hypothetical protein
MCQAISAEVMGAMRSSSLLIIPYRALPHFVSGTCAAVLSAVIIQMHLAHLPRILSMGTRKPGFHVIATARARL